MSLVDLPYGIYIGIEKQISCDRSAVPNKIHWTRKKIKFKCDEMATADWNPLGEIYYKLV